MAGAESGSARNLVFHAYAHSVPLKASRGGAAAFSAGYDPETDGITGSRSICGYLGNDERVDSERPRVRHWIQRVAGCFIVGLGIRMAVAAR
jgi:hypothetical protein